MKLYRVVCANGEPHWLSGGRPEVADNDRIYADLRWLDGDEFGCGPHRVQVAEVEWREVEE